MHFRPLLVVALACGLGFACGGGQKEPATSGTTTPSTLPEPVASSAAAVASSAEAAPAASPAPSASAAPTAKRFKDMSPEDKLATMKNVVMPKMKALFQEFDAKEFKDFSCATCHEDPKNKKFEMPNPKLPKLSFKDDMAKHKKKTPKMLEFMMNKVTPAMVEALNEHPFDKEKMTGFGCGGCHTFEK